MNKLLKVVRNQNSTNRILGSYDFYKTKKFSDLENFFM